MAEKVLMLALSPTMEEGTIANWLKKEGDDVANGDMLCEVETDKATMEYESMQEGTLLKILVTEGMSAVVEQTIAIIGEAGEDISGLVKEAESQPPAPPATGPSEKAAPETTTAVEAPAATPAAAPAAAPAAESAPAAPAQSGGRTKASPLARTLAAKAGIDLTTLSGSGPGGRIVKRDIEAAGSTGSPKAAASGTGGAVASQRVLEDQLIPTSKKRRIIAQRLAESKYSAPHFYVKLSVWTDPLMDARKALNATLDYKVSVNAFLLKFASESIKRVPVINSSWEGENIRQFGSIDIGLAVAQEDGLVTPIVRDCGSKGILAIDEELRDLIARARDNKLAPEEFTGATFSISSLGTFGVEEFTAIINPPGSAILAVGQMQKVPVVGANDEISVRTQMKLTLSCDHRIIDGAKGAKFLEELKLMTESPVRALY